MKNLYLRIDIDSFTGLTEGVPNLLKLFKKLGVKATFFLTVGREGNIFEYIKYKLTRPKKNTKKLAFPNSRLKSLKHRLWEILRILFFPRSFYKQRRILSKILQEGHELQIHCFSHVVWHNPSYTEAKKDLNKAIKLYEKYIAPSPQGFASPYYSFNPGIKKLLKESNFKYIAIHNDQKTPSICNETQKLNIPTTISISEKILPLCEYFAREGHSTAEVTKKALEEVEKQSKELEFLSTYIHPRIEGIELFPEFSKFLTELSKKYKINKTYSQIC